MKTNFYNQEDNIPYEYKEENVFEFHKSASAHDNLKEF